MRIRMSVAALLTIALFTGIVDTPMAPAQSVPAVSSSATVLNATEVQKIFPASVFFKGQTASSQGRNSGGVRLADKRLVMISLVDNSGYSSQVQERYQAYLITETALEIDGHKLPAGAYGCGFLTGDSFVVMDLGGHDLFLAHSKRDDDMHRPTPLQIQATTGEAGLYRLYAGRNFVTFRVAAGE
jgi:hypothetical protein